jgi:hypothetical protein
VIRTPISDPNNAKVMVKATETFVPARTVVTEIYPSSAMPEGFYVQTSFAEP